MKQETIERLTLFNTGLLVVLIYKVFSSLIHQSSMMEQCESKTNLHPYL